MYYIYIYIYPISGYNRSQYFLKPRTASVSSYFQLGIKPITNYRLIHDYRPVITG